MDLKDRIDKQYNILLEIVEECRNRITVLERGYYEQIKKNIKLKEKLRKIKNSK